MRMNRNYFPLLIIILIARPTGILGETMAEKV